MTRPVTLGEKFIEAFDQPFKVWQFSLQFDVTEGNIERVNSNVSALLHIMFSGNTVTGVQIICRILALSQIRSLREGIPPLSKSWGGDFLGIPLRKRPNRMVIYEIIKKGAAT